MLEISTKFIPLLLEISFFGYFFYVSIYNLILSIGGHLRFNWSIKSNYQYRKVGIFIPAYQEDSVIEQTVKSALEIDYPKELFHIIVIADSMQTSTVENLKKLPIIVIEVVFAESTKVRAIQYAIKQLEIEFDMIIILDADNIIAKDFIEKANCVFDMGFKIVQGNRIIKNPNNDIAILDGLSEQINTHINRKGAFNLGLSSSISGSGFAVDYSLGKDAFNSLDSIGGFDKEFELNLLLKGYKTAYCDKLIVYDEKVETRQIFRKQRSRWISSQYNFLRMNFILSIKALFRGEFLLFNSTTLRNFQLPRLLNLGLFTIIFILTIFISNYLTIPGFIWATIYTFFLISVLIAIPRNYFNFKVLLSLLRLPGIFLVMLRLMFSLKGVNRRFIHTPHGSRAIVKNE